MKNLPYKVLVSVLCLLTFCNVRIAAQDSDYYIHPPIWNPSETKVAIISDSIVEIEDIQSATIISTLVGHTARITSASWSPDGNRLATSSLDRTVRIWDSVSGNLQITYTGHDDGVSGVTWSPDGINVISAAVYGDTNLHVWNSLTGNLVLTNITGTSPIMEFNPLGDRLVSVFSSAIVIQDASSFNSSITFRTDFLGEPEVEDPTNFMSSVHWNVDGTKLVTGNAGGRIYVWDATTLTPISILEANSHYIYDPFRILNPTQSWVRDVAFSPNGQRILAASADGTIKVWDANTFAEIETIQTEPMLGASWSPSASQLFIIKPDESHMVVNTAELAGIYTVTSLSLLDSTSLPIAGHDPLMEAAVIDLGSVTASPLKFRANTNPATVGSVVFSLNGQVVGMSNSAPYDLNWTPLVGQHSLSATPYSGADGTGTAGSPYTVNFTVRQPRILYIHDGRIYSMNPDGTDSRVLVTGGSPAWSPDGTRIAYWGNSATGREIFVMNADGSNKTRLTYNNADDRNPSWSPNGNRIVYDSVVTGSDREIYVMNADGTNPVNITNNSVDDFDPSWSPAGDWIAFSSQAGDEDQIFIMRTNGNNRTRLTNSESNLVSPNWSPDGSMIVYTKLGTNTDIYRINADGTGGFRLTDNAATDQSPSWSADGTKILFSSLREPGNNNYFELYWMNANGTQERRLTNTANVNEVVGVPAYP